MEYAQPKSTDLKEDATESIAQYRVLKWGLSNMRFWEMGQGINLNCGGKVKGPDRRCQTCHESTRGWICLISTRCQSTHCCSRIAENIKRSWGGKIAWQEGGKIVVMFSSVRRKPCSMENAYADNVRFVNWILIAFCPFSRPNSDSNARCCSSTNSNRQLSLLIEPSRQPGPI
jgi:hypothetical protein